MQTEGPRMLTAALAGLRKYAVVLLVASAGLGASLYVHHDFSLDDRRAMQASLRSLAAERKERIEIAIDRALSSVHAIAGLFYVSGDVSRREFETFVRDGQKSHPEITRFQWQPKVRAAERRAFEAQARRQGLANFGLIEVDGNGHLLPARERPLHFPVLYEAPLIAGDNAIGLDLSWDPLRMLPKYMARDSGTAQASPILTIRRTTQHDAAADAARLGFTLSVPVYEQAAPPTAAERERTLRGFVAAVILVNNLLAPALGDLPDKGLDVLVFAGSTADARPRLFYRGLSPNSDLVEAPLEHYAAQPDDIVTPISVAGQHWRVVVHAPPGAFAGSGKAPVALILGLLCTALLSAYLFSTIRRREHFARVTRQQQDALTALAESERRVRYLVEGLDVIAWELDLATSRFTYVSPHAQAILGYPTADWYKEGFLAEHLHPDDRIGSVLDRVFNAGRGDDELDYRMLKADGSVVWLKDVASVLEDAQGKPCALRGITVDITERKRSEQEQHALEAKLRQAQKMESIGQLSGGIAHDFNNILAAVLGYAELTQMAIEDRRDEQLGAYLDEIVQATNRAKDLVAQLLTFSRSDEIAADTVIVAPIVREVVKLLRSTFPSTVSLSLDLAEELPEVRINPVQLHQVLMNLCINARDAVDGAGRIEISVGSVRLDALANCKSCHQDFQGEHLLLSVRDGGHGIRADDLTRIFTPFFTTKAMGKGTGLGLAVLHGIVHSAGGHVKVISEPGRTEFEVYLPAQPTTAKRVTEVARRARQAAGAAGRILLIDDEPPIVGSTTGLLENMGCDVTGLSDPEAALRLYSADPRRFDLVITDQTMPGLTGIELAHAMLALRPELPIILCTGFSKSANADSARAVGIRGFLQKPVPAGVLMETVKRLLAPEAVVEAPPKRRASAGRLGH